MVLIRVTETDKESLSKRKKQERRADDQRVSVWPGGHPGLVKEPLRTHSLDTIFIF